MMNLRARPEFLEIQSICQLTPPPPPVDETVSYISMLLEQLPESKVIVIWFPLCSSKWLPSAWIFGFLAKILDFFHLLPKSWQLILPRKPRIIKILARDEKSCHWKSEKKITVVFRPGYKYFSSWVSSTVNFGFSLIRKQKRSIWKSSLWIIIPIIVKTKLNEIRITRMFSSKISLRSQNFPEDFLVLEIFTNFVWKYEPRIFRSSNSVSNTETHFSSQSETTSM